MLSSMDWNTLQDLFCSFSPLKINFCGLGLEDGFAPHWIGNNVPNNQNGWIEEDAKEEEEDPEEDLEEDPEEDPEEDSEEEPEDDDDDMEMDDEAEVIDPYMDDGSN
nr:hypothetical protein [Tanacetum cinerariifolium]